MKVGNSQQFKNREIKGISGHFLQFFSLFFGSGPTNVGYLHFLTTKPAQIYLTQKF